MEVINFRDIPSPLDIKCRNLHYKSTISGNNQYLVEAIWSLTGSLPLSLLTEGLGTGAGRLDVTSTMENQCPCAAGLAVFMPMFAVHCCSGTTKPPAFIFNMCLFNIL